MVLLSSKGHEDQALEVELQETHSPVGKAKRVEGLQKGTRPARAKEHTKRAKDHPKSQTFARDQRPA